jgi:hypothetical protein
MTLSDYEKAQFETLTADFKVEDVRAVKQMEKMDKAQAQTFIALPGWRNLPLVAAFIALVFMIAGRVTENDAQMFAAGGVTILCLWLSYLVAPNTAPSTNNGEEDE